MQNEFDLHQVLVNRGEAGIDPLDGHPMLCRLKVAVGLALLAQHDAVTEDDWSLAGEVLTVSNRTRASVQAELTAKARTNRVAKALEDAAGEEAKAAHKLNRAKTRVLVILGRKAATRSDINRDLRSDLRAELDPALAELEAAGVITDVAGEWKATGHTGHRSTAVQGNNSMGHTSATPATTCSTPDCDGPPVVNGKLCRACITRNHKRVEHGVMGSQ